VTRSRVESNFLNFCLLDNDNVTTKRLIDQRSTKQKERKKERMEKNSSPSILSSLISTQSTINFLLNLNFNQTNSFSKISKCHELIFESTSISDALDDEILLFNNNNININNNDEIKRKPPRRIPLLDRLSSPIKNFITSSNSQDKEIEEIQLLLTNANKLLNIIPIQTKSNNHVKALILQLNGLNHSIQSLKSNLDKVI
jgi:hypothetical protein